MKPLFHFWWWCLDRLLGEPRRFIARHADDVPDILARGVVYLIGDSKAPWSAAMRCPGGCGRTLELNLLPDDKPVWRCVINKRRLVTLHPSVWLRTGCKCHFTLRDGGIGWV
jgi:hypothetical protein